MACTSQQDGGVTTWFNGDILTGKLTAEQTSGALGLIEATCPPGGRPAPHVHPGTDETFYMIAGELEFLQGDQVLTTEAGDVVFMPARHDPPLQQLRAYSPRA